MMEMTARTLPLCQDAVDALYRRITAGRVRAIGKAAATGLTGKVSDLDADELAILESAMSSRYGGRLFEIYMRDDLAAAGASEDDWALASELAYQVIRRDLTGADLARTVERIMRSGPYRQKWDEDRRGVTWLAQDVANAIATVQKRLADQPTLRLVHDEFEEDEAPVDETPEQTIARLERENRQLRANEAVQQTAIRAERAAKEAAVETIRRIGDVLAQPKEHLAPAPKILTIVALLEAHSRASRGVSKLPSVVLEERSGMTKNMVSAWIQDLAAREGSPIKRRLTREWRTNEYGIQEPITVSEVIPLHQTLGESLAAVLTMGGPSNKAEQQRRAAQERAEQQRQWGRCSSHDNDLVAVKGYCPECGEVVAERVMRVEEFDALNPLNHEIRETGPGSPPTVVVRTKGHEVRESAAQPLNLRDYAAVRPQERLSPGGEASGPRCGALKPNGRECVTTMYRDLGGGRRHCLGCGAQTVLAMMGAET